MPFEKDENNRSLTPTGNKSFPTVDVSAGTQMPPGILKSGSPMKAEPTRESLGDPEFSQPRKGVVKGPPIRDEVQRGESGPWSKGR